MYKLYPFRGKSSLNKFIFTSSSAKGLPKSANILWVAKITGEMLCDRDMWASFTVNTANGKKWHSASYPQKPWWRANLTRAHLILSQNTNTHMQRERERNCSLCVSYIYRERRGAHRRAWGHTQPHSYTHKGTYAYKPGLKSENKLTFQSRLDMIGKYWHRLCSLWLSFWIILFFYGIFGYDPK